MFLDQELTYLVNESVKHTFHTIRAVLNPFSQNTELNAFHNMQELFVVFSKFK